MSNIFLMNEGEHIDNAGNLIWPIYVDVREPADRTPITTLIKGCRKQYAIETYKRVRISKPALFRKFGEKLIKDPAEMYASHTEIHTETISDPDDLAEAKLLDEEVNRSSELLQSTFTTTTTEISTTKRHKQTEYLSFGKNGWLFSTSIAPEDQEEKDRWKESMPDEYNYISYIHRPREFARALGSMVAEQIGPQGNESELKHSFSGEPQIRTKHKVQIIFHGPVLYVEDPYKMIINASSTYEFMVLPIFVKEVAYRGQQEYRFAIWAEAEPSDEFVDLDVSLPMLGAMQGPRRGSDQQVHPTIISSDTPKISWKTQFGHEHGPAAEEERDVSSLLADLRNQPSFAFSDRINDPSTPIAPHSYSINDLPQDLQEVTTMYSAIKALRDAVGGPIRRRNLASERIIEAASSAWHAEPCIRHLCSRFEDPIKSISISDDNFVIVTVKFPVECQSEGKIAFGPRGTGTCIIKAGRREVISCYREARSMELPVGEELERAGLRIRQPESSSGSAP